MGNKALGEQKKMFETCVKVSVLTTLWISMAAVLDLLQQCATNSVRGWTFLTPDTRLEEFLKPY